MLPYDAEVLHAALAALNRAVFPAQIVTALVALGLALLAFWPRPWASRAAGLGLAALWATVGAVWHLTHFAALNFMAPIYGAVFVAQAVLLLWTGVVRGRLALRFRGDATSWLGLGFAGFGLVDYLLIFGLLGHGWAGLPVVGFAPVPTTFVTLGLLLLTEARSTWHLAIIPVLWSGLEGVTAWMLGTPEDYVLTAAALVTAAIILWQLARRDRTARRA